MICSDIPRRLLSSPERWETSSSRCIGLGCNSSAGAFSFDLLQGRLCLPSPARTARYTRSENVWWLRLLPAPAAAPCSLCNTCTHPWPRFAARIAHERVTCPPPVDLPQNHPASDFLHKQRMSTSFCPAASVVCWPRPRTPPTSAAAPPPVDGRATNASAIQAWAEPPVEITWDVRAARSKDPLWL